MSKKRNKKSYPQDTKFLDSIQPINHVQDQYWTSLLEPHSETDFYDGIIAAYGSAGTGKAQPIDSLVRTPKGWRKIGDLKVGEEVVCPDGTISTINGVYPQGEKETYRFIFEDSREVECCTEHLWALSNYKNKDKLVVKTAKEIKEMKDNLSKKYFESFKIPLIEHEKINDIELPLDPYFMGLIIGDGGITNQLTFTSVDEESIDYIKSIIDEEYTLNQTSDNITYRIAKKIRNSNIKNKYITVLENLGLMGKKSHQKFIPNIYKESSKEQKHQLLSGLIDSDGEIDKSGSIYYHTSSKNLKDDVVELIRSLGGIAYVKEKTPKYTYKGVKKNGKLSYSIRIRYKEQHKLCKLSRKTKLLNENSQYKNCGLKIKDIQDNGLKECVCISVNHPEHLYITDNYITTHNTFIAATIAAKLYLQGVISNIVITRPMVEAQQENIGALPGGLGEKFDPWVSNITGMLSKMIGKGKFECDYKNGNIKIEPVSFMRGKTFDNAFIIVDEAQNLTKENLKMVTTRTGQNARCILCGDTDQVDLPPRVQSGLRWFVEEVKRQNRPIDLIEFKSRDCVRSVTAKLCLELYDAAD